MVSFFPKCRESGKHAKNAPHSSNFQAITNIHTHSRKHTKTASPIIAPYKTQDDRKLRSASKQSRAKKKEREDEPAGVCRRERCNRVLSVLALFSPFFSSIYILATSFFRALCAVCIAFYLLFYFAARDLQCHRIVQEERRMVLLHGKAVRCRRSRSASNALGVYVCFMAVCCSTLMLQVLTTTTPAGVLFSSEKRAAFLKNSLVEGLITRFTTTTTAAATSSSSAKANDAAMVLADLRIGNVSVHRVRYVDGSDSVVEPDTDGDGEDGGGWQNEGNAGDDASTMSFLELLRAKTGFTLNLKKRAEVSGVVVTWDDRFKGDSEEDDEQEPVEASSSKQQQRRASVVPGRIITYEVQHWVNGWGFDALWHPSNRKFVVTDPFVVLSNLPSDHEIAFRVRMKVKKTTGLLSGFFATETDGPWSDVAVLSPSRDDAFEAILVFLSSNKAFFLVLSVCIGSGSLIVFKLLVSHRLVAMRQSHKNSAITLSDLSSSSMSSSVSSSPRKAKRGDNVGGSSGELEQEVKDLRQELADSESEVRKLMLYRGYGIEELSRKDLARVEQELRATLQRVQKLQQSQSSGCGKRPQDHGDEGEEEARSSRRLGAVYEDDAY